MLSYRPNTVNEDHERLNKICNPPNRTFTKNFEEIKPMIKKVL